MSKIKSFKLQPETRVGNYKILKPLGRGWEGEVYAVEEVPTTAKRAMKLIARENVDLVRDVTHTAWFFEQLAATGSVARYYHMGQWFLDDNEGLFFLVFEHLEGSILKEFVVEQKEHGKLGEREAVRLVREVAEAIKRVHRLGYAVGDLAGGANLIVSGDVEEPRPIFCDLDAGKADHPNVDFRNDAQELAALCKLIFNGLGSSSGKKQVQQLVEAAGKQAKPRQAFGDLVKQLDSLK